MRNLSVNQKRIMSFVLAFFVTLVIGFSIISISVNAEDTGEYIEKNGVMYRVINTLDEIKKAEPVYYNGSYYNTVVNLSYEQFIGWENEMPIFVSKSGLLLANDINYIQVVEDIVITEFNSYIQTYKIKVFYMDGTIRERNIYLYDGSFVNCFRSKNFNFGFSNVDILDVNGNDITPFDVNRDLEVTYSEDDENYIFTIETTQEAEYYCYIMAYEIEADNITHGRKIFDYESFVTQRVKENYITFDLQDIIYVLDKHEIPPTIDTEEVSIYPDWRYKFLYALQKKMQLYDSDFPDIDDYNLKLNEDLSEEDFKRLCTSFRFDFNNWYLFYRPNSVKSKFNDRHMFTDYDVANDFFDIKVPFETGVKNFRSATGKLNGNEVITVPKKWYNTVIGKPYDHTVLICNREQAMCSVEELKYFNFRFEGLGYDGSANPANDPNYKNTILDGEGNPTDYVIQDHIQASADDKAKINDNNLFGDGSFTGVTNGAFNWIKGFIYIFPEEIQTIITISLVIILAIGLIRLVVG